MRKYIYPQNLKATANLWLWSLRDFAILCMAVLLSVLSLVQLGFVLPLALSVSYAFLTIRLSEVTILDFIRYAVRYFILTQQTFEWR